MKTRYCRRCGTPIADSAHAWYCLKCRQVARKETMQQVNARRKLKRRLRNDYKYNKNYGIEVEDAKPKVLSGMSPASQRWAKMSLREISAECARFHLTYGRAQVMAQNGTLPEDWGLGE